MASGIITKTRLKPPSFLVFCGDKSEQLFPQIRAVLRQILPIDTYTIADLSKRALIEHPWMQYCACLLIADGTGLDVQSRARFNAYFLRNPSKILFVNENLSSALAGGNYADLFRNAFGDETSLTSIVDKSLPFINEKLAMVAKTGGEVSKSSFTVENVENGAGGCTVDLVKQKDQPLSIYLHHPSHERRLLFSGASMDELFKSADDDGPLPIVDLLRRLDIEVVSAQNGPPTSQQPSLTTGYLFNRPDSAVLNMTGMTYGLELGTQPKLLFCPTSKLADGIEEKFGEGNAKQNFLPVEVRRVRDGVPLTAGRRFDVDRYYGHLKSEHFGRALLFVPVCTSTMDLSDSISNAFPSIDGTLVVAGHQTAGRGRIGNEWLCAEGAAMFNVNLNVPFGTELGRSIVLLQHLMATSICQSIAQLAPDFPIKIKWPNDLYFGRLSKIGGVLVRTSQNEADQKYSCLIGVGLNVANSKPTVCINDMLPIGAKKLVIEEVLALVMNTFEAELANFQAKGKSRLVRDYYKFWLHTDEPVSILREESGKHEKATIRGLDESGYLLVQSRETGRHISLQSDGNSFDLFQGLIVPKSM